MEIKYINDYLGFKNDSPALSLHENMKTKYIYTNNLKLFYYYCSCTDDNLQYLFWKTKNNLVF